MRRADDLDLDLVLVAIASLVALAMALLGLPVAVRLPLGLVAVLVLPGYSVGMALFPPGELDAIERAALTFSLSLGVIVLAAPFMNLASGGLTSGTIVAALSGITLVAAAIAAWRRRGRATVGTLPGIDVAGRRPWRRPGRRLLAIGGLVVVALVALVAIGLAAVPKPATEFFMLGPDGTADSLPARVVSGAPTTITVGISNDDGSGEPYRIVVESELTQLTTTDPIAVGSDRSWTGTIDFTVPRPGNAQEIQILLFKGTGAEPFRSLRLLVDVLAPA